MNTNLIPIHRQLGLSRHPFPPAPDADGYFYTPDIEHRLAEAVHCLMTRKGFVLLTGEVGMGKSTFVRRLLTMLQADHHASVSLVLNTFVQGQELLAAILRDFGLFPGETAQESIECLNNYLIDSHRRNITCILVIDDAQNLTLESLELVRLLTNLETGQEKLLQIMLCGQPELLDTLQQPAIRQLASRIVEHLQLLPLTLDELGRYVDFRFALAGAGGRIQTTGTALTALHRHSGGNPRRIHLILDRCLYGLVSGARQTIDHGLVEAAAGQAGIQPRIAKAGTRSAAKWAVPATTAVIALTAAALWYAHHFLTQGESRVEAAASGMATATAPARVPDSSAPPVTTTTQADAPGAQGASSEAHVKTLIPAAGSAAARAETTMDMLSPAPAGPIDSASSSANDPGGLSILYRLCPRFAQARDLPAGRSPQLVWSLPDRLEEQMRPRDDVCLLPKSGIADALWLGDMAPENFRLSHAHDDVRLAQTRLQALGLYPDRPDGFYGSLTRQAMQAFQTRHTLAMTATPDTLTLMLLAGAAAQPASPDNDDALSSILSAYSHE